MKIEPAWYASPIALPEATSGKISVKHCMLEGTTPIIGQRQAYCRGIRPLNAKLAEPLLIHELYEEGHGLWMTDLPEELNQIEEMLHAVNPKGHVLVGGLGLGIAAQRLTQWQGIKSVTVVERSKDVIKLCSRPSYKTVCDSIEHFLRTSKSVEGWDYYLLDTWGGTNEGTWWDDVLPLRRAIRSKWGSRPKIHCWAEDIMWGQVKRQLMQCPQAHWHYAEELLHMTSREADRFLREAGLPTWEAKYGDTIDATYRKKKQPPPKKMTQAEQVAAAERNSAAIQGKE